MLRVPAVSILVLVDFSLKHGNSKETTTNAISFNPCFGGFFSKTWGKNPLLFVLFFVSILVLVDFSLKRDILHFD